MILDAIIGLFVSLFGALAAGAAAVFVPLVNVCAVVVEAVVGIFVSGFSLGRIGRSKGDGKSSFSMVPGILVLLLLIAMIGWGVVVPKVMTRKVTLVAEDGHSLPFAALVIRTGGSDRHEWTDKAGNIVIPRFATDSLTVKDPRYVEKTWKRSEIGAELTVTRSILGSGLDSLADRLLKSEKE